MSDKNKVQILKAARSFIKSGEINFICLAIRWVSGISYADAEELRELIRDRLRGVSTLEDWLLEMHGIRTNNGFFTRKKLVTTRLAWIDSLIEEFS